MNTGAEWYQGKLRVYDYRGRYASSQVQSQVQVVAKEKTLGMMRWSHDRLRFRLVKGDKGFTLFELIFLMGVFGVSTLLTPIIHFIAKFW